LLGSLPARSDQARGLLVDIEDLRWIDALPLAVLTAFCMDHKVRNKGCAHSIKPPRRYEYLQRMDFFEAVGARVPETFKRQDAHGRFVPVRQVVREVGGRILVASGAEVVDRAHRLCTTLVG
jgi:hypothetical protein